MKVGVDGRELLKDNMTGIGRFLSNFLKFSLQMKPDWEFVIFMNQHNVEVDVFLVNKQDFIDIDGLEGHPNWYKREIIPIELNDGNTVDAWIYFNDTIQDSGEHHHSYEIEISSYYDGTTCRGGWYDAIGAVRFFFYA